MNTFHTELISRCKQFLSDEELAETIKIIEEWERQEKTEIQASDVYVGVIGTLAVLYSFWFLYYVGFQYVWLTIQAFLG